VVALTYYLKVKLFPEPLALLGGADLQVQLHTS